MAEGAEAAMTAMRTDRVIPAVAWIIADTSDI
jgi:hypothetical protein